MRKFKILTIILIVLCLAACFSPFKEDEGTFSISFGSGNSGERAAFFDEDTISGFEHTIKLNGPGPNQTKVAVGAETVVFSVIPGQWNISVEAKLDGELFSAGFANVDIKPGQNGFVNIKMGHGSGTPEDPWIVHNAESLFRVGRPTTGGDYDGWTLYAHYRQVRDIDLSDVANWTPIGEPASNEPITGPFETCFTGVYNGNNKTISHLTINSQDTNYRGLFGRISGPDGLVENLNLADVDIVGGFRAGAIAGHNYSGTVRNCSVSGTVIGIIGNIANTPHIQAGGITGNNAGLVEYCISDCSVTGENLGTPSDVVGMTGGIAGQNASTGTILYCHSTGDVNGTNGVGGITGANYGTVKYSAATGEITGSGINTGGIAGQNGGSSTNDSVITDCYATGDVTGADNVGGITGFADDSTSYRNTVMNCYATGAINGSNPAEISGGGILGRNTSSAILQKNVALNPGVSMTGPISQNIYIGRVTDQDMSDVPGSSLTNNFARSNMNLSSTQTINNNQNDRNGLNITINDWESAVWWQQAAQFSETVWVLENGKLPTLKGLPGVQNPVIK